MPISVVISTKEKWFIDHNNHPKRPIFHLVHIVVIVLVEINVSLILFLFEVSSKLSIIVNGEVFTRKKIITIRMQKIAFICSFLWNHYYLSTLTLDLAKKWIELLGKKKEREIWNFHYVTRILWLWVQREDFQINRIWVANAITILLGWCIGRLYCPANKCQIYICIWILGCVWHIIIACMPKWPNTSDHWIVDLSF